MAQDGMAQASPKPRRSGAEKLGDLIGKVLDPLTARRGHATATLMGSWADVVGPAYAGWTRPEQIRWPRGAKNEAAPALLVVRVEGPRAIYFQHEAGQVIERVNAFFGYAAIGDIRIVQAPVAAPAGPAKPAPKPMTAAGEARLEHQVGAIGDDALRAALKNLGKAVLTDTGE
jgi:hypothetical protein